MNGKIKIRKKCFVEKTTLKKKDSKKDSFFKKVSNFII